MKNYFELFDLEERFDINDEELDKNYFELQAKYHPDMSEALGDAKVNYDMALLVNEAYKSLKSPWLRANHILELHGIFITDDKIAPKLPTEKLEEILEVIEAKDAGIKERLDKMFQNLAKAFASNNYSEAALIALEIRYINRAVSL